MAETAGIEAVQIGPFRGCVTSRQRDRISADELGPDSTNWWIDPIDGKMTRRFGSAIIGDTLSSGSEVSGILENAFGARAVQALEVPSPSLSDGYGTFGIVFVDESDHEGVFYFRSTNSGGSNQTIGKSYGTTHYSLSSGTVVRMKIPAFPVEGASGAYRRHVDATHRKFTAAGTRKAMQVKDRLYLPNADGTPLAWNMRFNDSSGAGTEIERVYPWGLPPPLFCPRLDTLPSALAGSATSIFKAGAAFYITCAYEFEDGSVGPMFAIRPASTTRAKGGTIIVGTAGGTSYYPYIDIKDIPIGPKMPVPCVARRVYVSTLQVLADANDKLDEASPFTLYACARIGNNTSTRLRIDGGCFTTLEIDSEMSFRHQWPPRAQIAVPVDGRTILGGKIRPNPCAIIISPINSNGTATNEYDLNVSEDGTTIYGSIAYHIWCDGTSLKLKKTAGFGGGGGTTTVVTFTLANYTLQELVDAINESTLAGIGGTDIDEWGCQLVPGVDGNIAASNLRATTDVGDDATVGDTTSNNIRVIGPNYPGYLAFTESFLSGFDADYQGSLMSRGGPSFPDGAYSNFQTRSGNRKGPSTSSVGDLLNIVPITGVNGVVAVYFYQNARYVLRNVRGGGTGEDEDYRLLPLDNRHGCASFLTCGDGPGFAYCIGDDGLWATDGSNVVVISNDSYDPDLGRGDWAAEISAALATTKSRGIPYLSAGILGRRLRVRYRSSTGISYPDRGQDYWFREGAEGGLGALLRRDQAGTPSIYGWSAPDTGRKFGITGRYFTSGGIRYIGVSDTNLGTANGRVDQIDVPASYRDNGTAYTSNGYSGVYQPPAAEDVALHRVETKTTKNGTGLSVTPYTDRNRAEAITPLAIPSSGTNPYVRRIFECDQAARGNKECLEFLISDDGTSDVAVDFSWLVAEIERSPAAVRLS